MLSQTSPTRPGTTPRRGFTHVEKVRSAEGPIVVSVDGSRDSVRAVRSAADEAMARSGELIVMDHGEPSLVELIEQNALGLEDRQVSVFRALLSNQNVHVLRIQRSRASIQALSRYCKQNRASLLVLSRSDTKRLTQSPDDLSRLVTIDCDVMMVGSAVSPG